MPNTVDSKRLREWWQTPLGEVFLGSEALVIKEMLATLFGYHLLVLGESTFARSVAESPILHRVWIHPKIEAKEDGSVVTSRYDKLPIVSDSIDLVYLAHCLEFIQNPHEVLREVYRALRSEGHVIIGNFNPWSSWGIWRWMVRYLRRAPWDGRFISLSRTQDWLALLGFDVVQVKTHFFRPPIAHLKSLQRLTWFDKIGRMFFPFWSGGYVILARKRVLTLTPIRPAFRREKIKTSEVIEPIVTES